MQQFKCGWGGVHVSVNAEETRAHRAHSYPACILYIYPQVTQSNVPDPPYIIYDEWVHEH